MVQLKNVVDKNHIRFLQLAGQQSCLSKAAISTGLPCLWTQKLTSDQLLLGAIVGMDNSNHSVTDLRKMRTWAVVR